MTITSKNGRLTLHSGSSQLVLRNPPDGEPGALTAWESVRA